VTTNERIAELLGATKDCNEFVIGKLCIWGNGRTFRAVEEMNDDGEMCQFWKEWSPDTDITLWHREDGLLAEIRRRSIRQWAEFIEELLGGLGVDLPLGELPRLTIATACLCATTTQLAAALVKVIEGTP